MAGNVVKVLVPTAVAAILLSQEFPLASLDTDGTLFTVVVYGATYSDAVAKVRAWMQKWRIGPVLVTDEQTAEELLWDVAPRRARAGPAALRSLTSQPS